MATNHHTQELTMQAQVFADAHPALAPEALSAKQYAAEKRAAKRLKALAALERNTQGERNAAASEYGLPGRWAKVTVLAPSNRGRNARGTSGAKRGYGGSQPKGAKRARKQNTHVRGAVPRISATRWGNI